MISIYLFVLDHDGFLLCKYKDGGAAEGSGHCSVIKINVVAPSLFLLSLSPKFRSNPVMLLICLPIISTVRVSIICE